MPAFFLPLASGETPSIGGFSAETLVSWMGPVNDGAVVARIGTEKEVFRRVDPSGSAWVHTVGARYRQAHGGWIEGQRYLCFSPQGTPMGVVNVTLHNQAEATQARVSNAFVDPSARRQGLATALLAWAATEHEGLVADSSLSTLGALLVGQVPSQVDPKASRRSPRNG